ncbi:hypothetical protein WJX72_005635 [[Myrmecia] bisecta]|uniref:Uncharacterized protein n=1 Tax=[Myrmecia] bisecta TaxID=41462 RepID=A0AAW1Q909_9CHLO
MDHEPDAADAANGTVGADPQLVDTADGGELHETPAEEVDYGEEAEAPVASGVVASTSYGQAAYVDDEPEQISFGDDEELENEEEYEADAETSPKAQPETEEDEKERAARKQAEYERKGMNQQRMGEGVYGRGGAFARGQGTRFGPGHGEGMMGLRRAEGGMMGGPGMMMGMPDMMGGLPMAPNGNGFLLPMPPTFPRPMPGGPPMPPQIGMHPMLGDKRKFDATSGRVPAGGLRRVTDHGEARGAQSREQRPTGSGPRPAGVAAASNGSGNSRADALLDFDAGLDFDGPLATVASPVQTNASAQRSWEDEQLEREGFREGPGAANAAERKASAAAVTRPAPAQGLPGPAASKQGMRPAMGQAAVQNGAPVRPGAAAGGAPLDPRTQEEEKARRLAEIQLKIKQQAAENRKIIESQAAKNKVDNLAAEMAELRKKLVQLEQRATQGTPTPRPAEAPRHSQEASRSGRDPEREREREGRGSKHVRGSSVEAAEARPDAKRAKKERHNERKERKHSRRDREPASAGPSPSPEPFAEVPPLETAPAPGLDLREQIDAIRRARAQRTPAGEDAERHRRSQTEYSRSSRRLESRR